jgi:TRAP transporter TAXI family solute receptor
VVRVAIGIVLAVVGSRAVAQQTVSPASTDLPQRDVVNAGTVTVITAPVGGPMSVMGSDMANVLDDGENLRVLPILGKGSVQNLIDIMLLKNVDMGFVTSDALEFVKTEYNVPDITSRVRYIAQLFHNDVHIVAREEIKSLRDLNGKRVFAERNIGLPAARIIFRRLGISADIDSRTDADGGLQKLLSGEGDAWVASVGKGAPVIKNIKAEGGKFHLLSIPYDKALQDVYLPETFSAEEYPNIVPQGARIETVAAPTVLMVYNWPTQSERYTRVARFVDALFDKMDQLQSPPRHPKWRDTVISAAVPGLQRFQPAQDWLNARTGAAPESAPAPVPAEEFRRFLAQRNGGANVSNAQAAKLYGDFLRWRDGQR